MAQSKADPNMETESKFETVSGVAPSVTITKETPAKADETSNPVHNDAKAQQAPVRTVDPQTPIAQTLAAGAGAHEPVNDPHIGADGRYYADAAEAKATHDTAPGK